MDNVLYKVKRFELLPASMLYKMMMMIMMMMVMMV